MIPPANRWSYAAALNYPRALPSLRLLWRIRTFSLDHLSESLRRAMGFTM